MVLFLLAGLLLTPLVIVAGRHMYLWKLKFRRSSIADVVGLELTEQAIQEAYSTSPNMTSLCK